MSPSIKSMNVAGLKAALHDGGEIALLDAREEVPFDARHMLMAGCLPLGRVEVMIDDLVPRRKSRRANAGDRLRGYLGPEGRYRRLGSCGASDLFRRSCAEQGIR